MNRTAFKNLPKSSKVLRRKSLAKYAKTKQGFLCRLYKNMRGRVEGIQKLKSHLYLGLPLMERSAFYTWALQDNDFHSLFKEWEDSNYNIKLTPSVDRISAHNGYIESNVRWVTHRENSRLGAISRWSR